MTDDITDDHIRLAGEAHRSGDLVRAERHYREALLFRPGDPGILGDFTYLLCATGRSQEALAGIDSALGVHRDNPVLLAAKGQALETMGRPDLAMPVYQTLISLQPENVFCLYRMGVIFSYWGRIQEALEVYEKAVALKPDFVKCLALIGDVRKQLGDKAGAEQAYREVLRRSPGMFSVYRLLSSLKKFTGESDADYQTMSRLLSDERVKGPARSEIHFALAKVCMDFARHEEALSHWRQGNALVRSGYSWSLEDEAGHFERVKKMFGPSFFARRSDYGLDGASPIFIVGMLRSGTSLLEQMLDRHPEVHACGEANELPVLLRERLSSLEAVGRMKANESRVLARQYLERMRPFLSNGTQRFVDKQLFNFKHVGVIRLLFPEARIINCYRGAMDTCFSIYRNYFTNLREFAYDQYEIGRYFGLWSGWMGHWTSVLPDHVYPFSYEELIDNPEREMRGVLEFCGLPWDDACLHVQQSSRVVRTASWDQANRPLYRGGVGQWKPFSEGLVDIRRGLRDGGIDPSG